MKKFLALAIIAASVIYLSYQFIPGRTRDEAEPSPQIPQNTIEIYGKIKHANGNEIVLAVGNMAGSGRGGTNTGTETPGARGDTPAVERGERQSGARSDNGPPRGERTDNAAGTAQATAVRRQNTGEGQAARGGQGGGFSMRGDITANSSSLELTGEERTFLIPVTAKITTGSGENERTVRFTQLAYKNTVRLTLNETGGVIAVNVIS